MRLCASMQLMTATQLKVLFVDDESDIRTIAEIALKHAKYDVELCDSGKQALERAMTFKPDLILLDVMMPDLDGIETLKKMQRNEALKSIPVIFISAKVQKREVSDYLKLGAIGVISKPFDPLTLGKSVDAIWSDKDRSN
jgi:two-component system OmpR family response regulator